MIKTYCLISHVMKKVERIRLNLLTPHDCHAEDTLLFAYHKRVGVEDIILYPYTVYTYFDKDHHI